MAVASIAYYYRKQTEKLLTCLQSLAEDYNEETVHNLRLVYKRIRALHKFTKSVAKRSVIIEQPVKMLLEIYKKAGIIRECQINLKLLSKYYIPKDDSNDGFIRFLNEKKGKAGSQMMNRIIRMDSSTMEDARQNIFQSLAGIDEKYLKKRGVQFIRKKVRKIESLVLKGNDDTQYHKIRVHIKELIFFLKMIYKRKYLSKMQVRLDHLKNIEVLIGKWNDNNILLRQLHEYFKSKHISIDSSVSGYNRLISGINHRQDVLIRNIDRKIVKITLDMPFFRRVGK